MGSVSGDGNPAPEQRETPESKGLWQAEGLGRAARGLDTVREEALAPGHVRRAEQQTEETLTSPGQSPGLWDPSGAAHASPGGGETAREKYVQE